MSHPLDNFDNMMIYSTDDKERTALEAFAAAERALLEGGIGFTVVERPEAEIGNPPLAA